MNWLLGPVIALTFMTRQAAGTISSRRGVLNRLAQSVLDAFSVAWALLTMVVEGAAPISMKVILTADVS